ncbi:hypothetical protein T05_3000 [Trichinella murrelli]|uniref:Uncharacterized protein n=1 Tax=Trichinella murrelli TaxID=144512 RepID=A0A0V0TC37_9BILA|nr:hypothetical protein T05_3000 [Trichinella murrelli]
MQKYIRLKNYHFQRFNVYQFVAYVDAPKVKKADAPRIGRKCVSEVSRRALDALGVLLNGWSETAR